VNLCTITYCTLILEAEIPWYVLKILHDVTKHNIDYHRLNIPFIKVYEFICLFQCNLEKDNLSAEMVGEYRLLWLRLSELVSGVGTFRSIAGSLCVVTIHLSLGFLCAKGSLCVVTIHLSLGFLCAMIGEATL